MMPIHGQVAANVEAGPGGAAETRLTINDRTATTGTITEIVRLASSTTDPSALAS